MTLLTNEVEILISDDHKAVLTNQRIGQSAKDWGFEYSIRLFLEDISAVEMKAQSIPALLILGILLIAVGAYIGIQGNSDSQHAFLVAGFGLVLILAWLQTKKRVIKISSCGAPSLSIDVKRMSSEKSDEFMNKLQQAKANRMEYLFKK